MSTNNLLFLLIVFSLYNPERKYAEGALKGLSEIRYHFTPCGSTGYTGPTFEQCETYYEENGSPIATDQMLFQFDEGGFRGGQGFQIPRNDVYNVTIAGAAGGRGLCNIHFGLGRRTEFQINLTTDYELLVMVGQKGRSPCDIDPDHSLCQNPPTTMENATRCNQSWYELTGQIAEGVFYNYTGGAGGGGASLIRARNVETGTLLPNPIAVSGGGGGTSAVLNYDDMANLIRNRTTEPMLPIRNLYNYHINARSFYNTDILGGTNGSRGYKPISVLSFTSGAGGGWASSFFTSSITDGKQIGLSTEFAEGGPDCDQLFGMDGVFQEADGGFGGGGGECGGGGGGGGYTGGAVLDYANFVVGGGGHSVVFHSNQSLSIIGPLRYAFNDNDGFVDIVPANCNCTGTCVVNQTADAFECICSTNATLALDGFDCYQDTDISIIEENTPSNVNGFYYKYIEIENSFFIFSNDIEIQSNNEMCVLFWLGESSQIVLATTVGRGTGRIKNLAVLDDTSYMLNTNASLLLRSSVLVTGALLVGTGNCSVIGNTVSVNASSRISSYSIVSLKDYRNNTSLSEQVELHASVIASRYFEENVTPGFNSTSDNGPVVQVIASVTVVGTLLLAIALIVAFAIITRTCRKRYSTVKNEEKSFKLKTNLTGSFHKQKLEYVEDTNLNDHSSSLERSSSHDLVERISFQNLNLVKIIGKGEFGVVYLAEMTSPSNGSKLNVAAKTINGLFDQEDINKLKKECRIISHLDHPNVLSLIGICLDDKVPYLIMPLMERGSVLMYLRKERQSLLLSEKSDKDDILTTKKMLLDMCYQIAKGMEYITMLGIVHRDLAARNCMFDSQGIIKVSDFGLSESIYTKTYLQLENHKDCKLPVKWTAPESISDGIFSEKTDIWSFGITCWEVFSAGKTPYPGIHPLKTINMVDEGYRMEKPKNEACDNKMYSLMMECWDVDKTKRPSFSDVVNTLSTELEILSDYFQFGVINYQLTN